MGAEAGGHDRVDGKFPDCIDCPGIHTFTEGPSTVITFEDEDEDGFEEEGGGATPLIKIPMIISKTFQSMVPLDVV